MLVFTGLMPVAALGVDIVLGAAPPERAGAASAISETTQEFGLALGIAILGSISTAVYRAQITDAIPAQVPAAAAQSARDTLGGATGAADQLPPALLTTAGEAFTSGLQIAAALSAIALATTAVLAAIVLRRVRAATGTDSHADHKPDAALPTSTRVEQSPRPAPAA